MTARDRRFTFYGLLALAAAVLLSLATGGFNDPASPAYDSPSVSSTP